MTEIERKFLLKQGYNVDGLLYTSKCRITDTYLTNNLRVRNKDNTNEWIVTLKGNGDIERSETEMIITVEPKFNNIIPLTKTRLIIPYQHQNFEVNIFDNIYYKGQQLVLIETELNNKYQNISLPEWVGEEVTYDTRFYGHQLAAFIQFFDFFTVK